MFNAYFLGTNNQVYTAEDIVKAAYIINGIVISDYDELVSYVSSCEGIKRKLNDSSIEDLVIMGRDMIAIKRYRDSVPNVSLTDAAEYVRAIKRKYNIII